MRNVLTLLYLYCLIPVMLPSENWIRKGIDHTINTEFDSALAVFSRRLDRDSSDIRANFYLAATYNSRMTHFESTEDQEIFYHYIDRTIHIAETRLNGGKDLPDSTKAQLIFYQGSAYGYRAFYEGQHGSIFNALSDGLEALELLETAVAWDSTLYDAYLGIGTFRYWRYRKMQFLSWLPFFPDERAEGIELIKKSIRAGTVSRYIAMQQLVYILVDYGECADALTYSQEITQAYPRSQFMWMAAAFAYYKCGFYKEAERAYRYLISMIENHPNRNPNHLYTCRMKLAEIYNRQEDFTACYAQCRTLLDFLEYDLVNDSKGKQADVRELMFECESRIRQNQ